MNRCCTCKHYQPIRDVKDAWYGLGYCARWLEGYGVSRHEVRDYEVLVENDEGWGAIMGPAFGCVLHETAT